MRQIAPWPLWIAHAGDMRDLPGLLRLGAEAIVDLAIDERALAPPRQIVYCRFPLTDGAGSGAWMVQAAIQTTALLIGAAVPTIVCCSAGMSRSPAIAAGALAVVSGDPAMKCLEVVVRGWPADVSPILWGLVQRVTKEVQGDRGRRARQ